MNVGAGNAFNCCEVGTTEQNPGNFTLFAAWGRDRPSDSINADLVGQIYYPIRLFYVNRDYVGGLNFIFTDPSGIKHYNRADYIFSADDGASCDVPPTFSTIGWQNTFTSTYTTVSTFTNSLNVLTTAAVIVAETPLPITTSSFTITDWTGSITSTYSTAVLTGTDQITTVETIYYIETPTVKSDVSTTYIPSAFYQNESITTTEAYALSTVRITVNDVVTYSTVTCPLSSTAASATNLLDGTANTRKLDTPATVNSWSSNSGLLKSDSSGISSATFTGTEETGQSTFSPTKRSLAPSYSVPGGEVTAINSGSHSFISDQFGEGSIQSTMSYLPDSGVTVTTTWQSSTIPTEQAIVPTVSASTYSILQSYEDAAATCYLNNLLYGIAALPLVFV